MKKKIIKTKEEARNYAIKWQQWQSEQNLSYVEIAEWGLFFNDLSDGFDLRDEFKENGII